MAGFLSVATRTIVARPSCRSGSIWLHARIASRTAKRLAVPASLGPYDEAHLARNAANFTALTPLNFLARAAAVYPSKVAVIDGSRRFTYAEFYLRCRRFAGALRRRGIREGDTVSVFAPNVPAL